MPLNFPDFKKTATAEAMDDPQVGDRYHEMYNFWMWVVYRDGDTVVTMEANPPCVVPKDCRVRKFASVAEFQKAYAYESIPRYWVRLSKRRCDVRGWYTLNPEDGSVSP